MKKIFTYIVLLIICVMTVNNISVLANENTNAGVEVSFKTNKNKYDSNDEIKATLKVKNTNSYPVTNFMVTVNIPAGYEIKNPEDLPQKIKLKANESESYKIILTKEGKKEIPVVKILLMAGLVAVVMIAVAIILILVLKRKKGNRVLSAILVIALLTGLLSYPISVQAGCGRIKQEHSVTVKISGKEAVIKANVVYDYNEDIEKIGINTNNFGYNHEDDSYTVLSKTDAISGWLKDAEKYESLTLTIYDEKGNVIYGKTIEPEKNWKFEGIGFYPCKNKVVVEAIGSEKRVTEIYLTDLIGINYFGIEGATTDSDKDGLYDLIEKYHGTDINKQDTDGDGLTDYEEINKTKTNPLIVDTDGNGISDYKEDCDGDKLLNGDEFKTGTLPDITDSDFDGLTDYEEINTYGTSPVLSDTDKDGGNDGWEIEKGYDPLVLNKSFNITSSGIEVSKHNPVGVVVDVLVDGSKADVNSLKIEKVHTYDNPFISATIAGYLGNAYNITIDGAFDKATLTFNYDTNLGKIGEGFEPRIYYFNEDSKLFEELENQKVTEGKVTAETTHFSTYTLLNKAIVDAINVLGTMGEIEDEVWSDVLFVVDNSASMAYENELEISKNAMKYVIGKLRKNHDESAIMTYTKKTNVAVDFTISKKILESKIDGIVVDNGVSEDSGTDIMNALYEAIKYQQRKGSGSRNIILFTDNNANSEKYSYSEIEKLAKEAAIDIYVVGVGIDKFSDEMTELINNIGGMAICINEDTDMEKALDGIVSDVMPVFSDKNGDGISDNITEMIKNGEILLGNGSTMLKNYDLNYDFNGNLSDDCDGDGLKNREEISIVRLDKKLYINMKSNPLMKYSDGDEYDDKTEVKNGTDPLKTTIEGNIINKIMDDENFYMYNYVGQYQEDLWKQAELVLDSFFAGTWSVEEIYRKLMIDYYVNYATIETLENESLTEKKRVWIDVLDSITGKLGEFTDGMDLHGDLVNLHSFKSVINGVEEFDDDYFDTVAAALLKLNNKLGKPIMVETTCDGLTTIEELTDVSLYKELIGDNIKVIKGLADAASYISIGTDIAETISDMAKVNANAAVFTENLDELNYIINYSGDSYAREAATIIRNQLVKDYAGGIVQTIGKEVTEVVVGMVLDKLGEACPYVMAFSMVQGAMNFLFADDDEVTERYEMLCYYEMTKACKYLFNISVGRGTTTHKSSSGVTHGGGSRRFDEGYKELYYDIKNGSDAQVYRYMVHLVQLRILGEIKIYEYVDNEGLLGFIADYFSNLDESANKINNHIAKIKERSDEMGLVLSNNMNYSVG